MTYSPTDADYAACDLVAAQYGRMYSGYVDSRDVYQECVIWFLEHPLRAAEYTDKENKWGERQLYNSLRRAADSYCRGRKSAKLGFDIEDEYFYSTGQVQNLLSLYFDPEWMWSATSNFPKAEAAGAKERSEYMRCVDAAAAPPRPSIKALSTINPEDCGNLMAMVADVGRAYKLMAQRDRDLLYRIYGEPGLVEDSIAVEADDNGVSVDAQKKRIKRVVGRLRKKLGGSSPHRDRPDEETAA